MNFKFVLINVISVSRTLLGWMCYLALLQQSRLWSVAPFLITSVALFTDFIDGRLARSMGATSNFGKWIDAFSDFIYFLFVYLAFVQLGLMPVALLVIFLARELAMYAVIRPVSMQRGLDSGARMAGKIKTGAQFVGTYGVLVLILVYRSAMISETVLSYGSVSILAFLVTASAASLYWYIVPLFSADDSP